MKLLLPVLSLLAVAIEEVLGAAAGGSEPDKQLSRSEWIGVRAPPLTNIWDRVSGPMIALDQYRGRKVLLYSFEAGNFANAPDEEALYRELQALRNALASGQRDMRVIGFTRGVMFFGIGVIPPAIKDLTAFPIVNLNNRRDDLALLEPYDVLLHPPSAILIDENGVIRDVFSTNMTVEIFQKVARTPAWKQNVRERPQRRTDASQGGEEMVVVVAARGIAAGMLISRVDLAKNPIIARNLPEAPVLVAEANQLIGKKLRKAVRRGEPLSWNDVEMEERDHVSPNDKSVP